MAAQFALYWAIQSNAIQSIVLCAQTMDNILIDIAGTTCGIAMRFDQSPIMCVSDKGLSASPFGDQFMLGTFGLLIVFILCFPLSKIDLDSNINLQLLWAALSTFILGQWISAAFLFQTTPLYAANPPKLQVIGEGVEGIHFLI